MSYIEEKEVILFVDGNVSITGDLVVGTTNIIEEIGSKQDEINTGDLSITDTAGLESALTAKYDKTGGTITGNVVITGDLEVGTKNIITEIGTKQDTIQDGDLTIEKTSGLQTALDGKQDTITIEKDLTINSLTTTKLNLPLYFDTIVIRRPTSLTGEDYLINLTELQCWVNNINILASNYDILTSYFALWSEKNDDIGAQEPTSEIYNNIIEDLFWNTRNRRV